MTREFCQLWWECRGDGAPSQRHPAVGPCFRRGDELAGARTREGGRANVRDASTVGWWAVFTANPLQLSTISLVQVPAYDAHK